MELLNTHPIKKSDLGFHGNLFGGKMLAWIDAAAAGYAMQLCDTPRMVTISIDKCFFEKPAKEGSLVKIYGTPHKVGTTSISLYMECRAHNVYTGEQKVVLRTHIKFVRIDEEGNPIPISDRAKNRITKIIEGGVPSDDKII
jgi:acyl-CoA thioesterase YciA